MNFLQKIFGKGDGSKLQVKTYATQVSIQEIQDNTDKLWKLLEETVNNYNTVACQCSFPRFRQYTSIDCTETQNAFYMSETEGLIHFSKKYFNAKEIDKGPESYRAVYSCLKCGSTYEYGWSDFSIHVNRTYLKPLDVQVQQLGADVNVLVPFFVGLFGHSYPDRNLFRQVDYDTFKEYLQERQNGV